jgi:hypothetical protein
VRRSLILVTAVVIATWSLPASAPANKGFYSCGASTTGAAGIYAPAVCDMIVSCGTPPYPCEYRMDVQAFVISTAAKQPAKSVQEQALVVHSPVRPLHPAPPEGLPSVTTVSQTCTVNVSAGFCNAATPLTLQGGDEAIVTCRAPGGLVPVFPNWWASILCFAY